MQFLVGSVSQKTTKNGDTMAFFKLEDRFGEIECIAFAKQYSRFAHLIRIDGAVGVIGNLSFKEDEQPRVLISSIVPLTDNSSYAPPAVETPRTVETREPEKKVRKLYLRVPSIGSEQYKKCENLIQLFAGDFPVVYYDASTKKYLSRSSGVALSEYLLGVFREYIGNDNAVVK